MPKDLVGSGQTLIKVLSHILSSETEENHEQQDIPYPDRDSNPALQKYYSKVLQLLQFLQ
jgi:hypothetical protein